MSEISLIRNFSIIAHIDHGKSTLADRFIQRCGGLSEREMSEQVLDTMELERERGITIKAQSVMLHYRAQDKKCYQLNLIDTPGHVDFSYEVSRSLAACEGALLLVDARQGVEAQTVAVCYTAIDQGLVVLPVLNKMDLPGVEPERVIQEIEDIIGIQAQDALKVSAKTGIGVEALLETLIKIIPPPQGDQSGPLQALIMDSWFDNYLGVVSLVRVKQGVVKARDKILMMSTSRTYVVDKLGKFTPKPQDVEQLSAGEVGYIIAGVKDIQGARVGDTITEQQRPSRQALLGYEQVKPKVFAGLFPIDSDDYESFREALAKLSLNDAALFFEPETSEALGFGFRCGFLGVLHMEIVQERLSREYQLELIMTAPTVIYEVITTDNQVVQLDNPSDLPPIDRIAEIREPIVKANILVPQAYLGNILTLCAERRGVQINLHYLGKQVSAQYELPMNEVVADFFDRLKSLSRGYASLDYNFDHFTVADLVRLDILINGRKVDALSCIVHRSQSIRQGRELVEKLRHIIPRQLYDVAIQAAFGKHIIARETVKALRKNVTAKCYGGDITRKKKLLEKQKAGKKRMKQVGQVVIPQEAFLTVFKRDTGKKKS